MLFDYWTNLLSFYYPPDYLVFLLSPIDIMSPHPYNGADFFGLQQAQSTSFN